LAFIVLRFVGILIRKSAHGKTSPFLFRRLRHLSRYNDGDPMPAAPRGRQFVPLYDDKIALIRAWIDQGAD
jgi:hypothetical protein